MEDSAKETGRGRQKFAELLCDFMFKRLFGSEANKDVLLEFLNMILEDKNIEHVDFIPKEDMGTGNAVRQVGVSAQAHARIGRNPERIQRSAVHTLVYAGRN